MNMNWKILKIVGAFVVIIGVIFWATISTLPKSYSGIDLNFEVGDGAVIVTNPSDQSIPVQFMRTGTRSFSVTSDINEVSGSSTREVIGSTSTQLFEFVLPSGTSEFSIIRGENVSFVAVSSNELDVVVYPMTAEATRNAIIAMTVVIVGALFYVSQVIEHRWITMLRGKDAHTQDTEPTPILSNSQGHGLRSFGDNRAETGD